MSASGPSGPLVILFHSGTPLQKICRVALLSMERCKHNCFLQFSFFLIPFFDQMFIPFLDQMLELVEMVI